MNLSINDIYTALERGKSHGPRVGKSVLAFVEACSPADQNRDLAGCGVQREQGRSGRVRHKQNPTGSAGDAARDDDGL
jgi:hypothetical protein